VKNYPADVRVPAFLLQQAEPASTSGGAGRVMFVHQRFSGRRGRL
jgi:hypothetical protein